MEEEAELEHFTRLVLDRFNHAHDGFDAIDGLFEHANAQAVTLQSEVADICREVDQLADSATIFRGSQRKSISCLAA
jgi:hypothetical protein